MLQEPEIRANFPYLDLIHGGTSYYLLPHHAAFQPLLIALKPDRQSFATFLHFDLVGKLSLGREGTRATTLATL